MRMGEVLRRLDGGEDAVVVARSFTDVSLPVVEDAEVVVEDPSAVFSRGVIAMIVIMIGASVLEL